ncbi:MAG: hypothetical protein APF80_09260 [Alphaproteobacteria bacterium BRH_c36]|nr:MAG: hypothetical protein APF80_09260 [Alphaproteobacteria bacterium BRH_c36]
MMLWTAPPAAFEAPKGVNAGVKADQRTGLKVGHLTLCAAAILATMPAELTCTRSTPLLIVRLPHWSVLARR